MNKQTDGTGRADPWALSRFCFSTSLFRDMSLWDGRLSQIREVEK